MNGKTDNDWDDTVRDAEIDGAIDGLATKRDQVNYHCPECGYDGGSYRNGRAGWVDATSPDSDEVICASCGEDVADYFQCERCKRHLSGPYFSADDCNKTGRDVTVCGQCMGVDNV